MTETVQLTLFESEALDKRIQENSSARKKLEPIVDLEGNWIEDVFQHIGDRKYRARLYPFLREHGYHEILRIIMVTVELKRSQRMTGKNNPAKRPEVRAKISAASVGKIISEETRVKMKASLIGENHPNWQGGISFEPYCPRFNYHLKEQIRNRDNRICVLCGKGEIQNGQRLSVHHIDSDKMQGCNGKKWHLCALCRSCNAKPDTVEKEFLIVTNFHGSSVNVPTSTNLSGFRIV